MLRTGSEPLLKDAFHRVLLVTAAVTAGLFASAALVEYIKSSEVLSHNFADRVWVQRLRAFLYLMSMFNILVIRYVVMRIYISPGPDDIKTIVSRLTRADIAAMLLSALPCVYGIALFLLTGDQADFYLLFGLSIIYGMIYFPRYKKWESILEENTIDNKVVEKDG